MNKGLVQLFITLNADPLQIGLFPIFGKIFSVNHIERSGYFSGYKNTHNTEKLQ